jgi:DNA primase catalytic core
MSPNAVSSAAVGRGSDEWVERVRAASDIVEIIGQTLALKRSGRNWVGLCPFHGEKTPSFAVHPERQFYHCFSCKAGGDVFRWVQEMEKVGFLEAVELLSRRAGIPVPERRGGMGGARRPVLDALEAAATAYENWLRDPKVGEIARKHLESRGVSDDVARAFRLGFAPPGWESLGSRLSQRFPPAVLEEAGLAVPRQGGSGRYDRFRSRLMVPLIAPGGAVVGFGARALAAGDEPKYLNSPEGAVYHKSAFLYGYEQARRALPAGGGGEMVIVEGYFDVIAMHQAGVRHVVAASGTALTPDHARQLKRVVSSVAITFDGDAAGRGAMLRALGTLAAAGLDVWVVELPNGEDPDTLVRAGGEPAWRSARERAVDPVLFIQRHVLQEPQPQVPQIQEPHLPASHPRAPQAPTSGDPRERALQAVVEVAARVEDPVRSRLLLERAEQVFGVEPRVLARALSLRRSGERSAAPIAASVRARATALGTLERQVLQALLLAPEHREGLTLHLTPQDFEQADTRALATALWEGHPAEGAAAELERELIAGADDETDWGALAQGCARRLLRRRYERERREIQERLRRPIQGQDVTRTEQGLREYQRLTERIRELEQSELGHHAGESGEPRGV